MLDRELIRQEFGYLGDHAYLNASMVGMPPKRVLDAARRFMDDYVASFNDNIKSDLLAKRNLAKQRFAQLIGAEASEISFQKNVTESLSTFAMGYRALTPGTNAIIVDCDFPNCIYPWINAHHVRGFALKVYRSERGQVNADELISMMDENTRVLSLSMVTSCWGCRVDLETLGRVCRARGIAFVVDAVQGLGRLALDAKRCNIDYLCCGGYKGMMGTWGAAFVYCDSRTGIVRAITPPVAGYQSATGHHLAPEVTTEFDALDFRDDVGRLEAGSQCTYAIESIGLGASLLLELGPEEVERQVLALDRRARAGLKDLPIDVITPDDPARLSGVVVSFFPKEKTDALKAALQAHLVHANVRPGYLRITIAVYNTERDIDAFLAAVRDVFA